MNEADYNRAKDKAESWSEWFLMLLVGFPKPWTAVAVGVLLVLAGVGAVTVWKAL